MLTAQEMANQPEYIDDLWNLKIIFALHDNIRELEFSTLFSTVQIEELKTSLWKWKFLGMSGK